MRASRLLQILLLLQNRGRMTSRQLAEELEVVPRTILRDVDAMTEAGLPIIVHQGNRGGIELGFNYRTRLTGLDADEAEAMGLLLFTRNPAIDALGLTPAADRAARKLIESFPDTTRTRIETARQRFGVAPPPQIAPDARVAAIAGAIRDGDGVMLRARSRSPVRLAPDRLEFGPDGWVVSGRTSDGAQVSAPLRVWGDINIFRRSGAQAG